MKTVLLIATSSLLLSLPAAAADTTDSAAPPNLSGSWLFNQEASDDARAKFREAMGGEGRGGPGMGGRGGMGGRRGGRSGEGRPGGGRPGENGEGRGPGGGGEGRSGMRDLFEPEDMTISQDGAAVTFVYGVGDRERTLLTDGSKVTKEGEAGREREIRAEWKGAQLVVRSEGEGGRKSTETYELGPDGKRLSVKLEIETPRTAKAVVIMRIYDRGKESGSGD